MMLNKISIMGRLTSDPEIRYTPAGDAVSNFTLAVERNFKNKQGERGTDFIDCVAWRNTGEFAANYLKKGKRAVVEGRLQIRSYETDNGDKRKVSEVVVNQIHVIDWPDDGQAKKGDEGSVDVPF